MKSLSLSVFFLLAGVSASFAEDVYLIGLDALGKEVITQTSISKMEASLLGATLKQKEVVLSVLESQDDSSQWKLSQFSLGLGVEGEAGLGPWKLGLAVKQRLIFKRKGD